MSEKSLVVAIQAAMRAAELLKRGYRTQFSIENKGHLHNLVTEYDRASEKEIVSAIHAAFPKDGILAEEGGHTPGTGRTWIIDPLDGTSNFAHNLPIFSISIAVVENGEVVAGVIYAPLLGELFTAMKGKGAHLNGKKLSVSETPELTHAMIATGLPPNCSENPRHCIDDLTRISKKGCPIRRMGSACIDLAYVACGRFDAFWEASLQSWDYAAGQLMIEEAGGTVTAYQGNSIEVCSESSIIATNGRLHGQLTSEIQ